MEHLIMDLIEQLKKKREIEFKMTETHKVNHLNELVLIASGKIMEIDEVIRSLEDLLKYHTHGGNSLPKSFNH